MSAIDAEIAICREEDGIGVGLGHADEAGVGKAHRHVRILLHESQDGLLLLTEHKGRQQLTTEEKRRERSGAVPPKQKECLGEDGLTCPPGRCESRRLDPCPFMMTVSEIQKGYQEAGISEVGAFGQNPMPANSVSSAR